MTVESKSSISRLGPLKKIYHWLMKMAEHHHATKVLALFTFMEASFFPLPTDPMLLAMGLAQPKKSFYFALITTLFSVLGAIFGYYLGAWLWESVSPWFFQYILSEEIFTNVVERYKENV